MPSKRTLGVVVFVASALLFIFLLTITYNYTDYTIKEVPCVDQHNREFIDQMCEQRVYDNSVIFTAIVFSLIGFFGLLYGASTLLLDED